jgi:magnesium chelatase family protein
VLLVGPPGSGKTMLAKRIVTILPPLSFEEALECTKIHSISGLLAANTALVTTRPFRSPHHSISDAGLIGGGSIPRPGEVSLAHHGILFLDELPEFKREVLEVMRQPLEDGQLTISRAAASLTYPARCTLVAAMNPCPCGYATDGTHSCSCQPFQVQRYLQRISGPLLDRIDIHIEVPRLQHEELLGRPQGEPSTVIRERVVQARAIQQERFCKERGKLYANGAMQPGQIRKHCRVDGAVKDLLGAAIQQLGLSARAYDRSLKLSRTIADLAGSPAIEVPHVAEAIQYRTLDRRLWG